MRESKIEKACRENTEAMGGEEYKFICPGVVGMPDRLRLLPIAPHHRAIVNAYVQFVEYKKLGKKPEPHQGRRHTRLRELGFMVHVKDKI